MPTVITFLVHDFESARQPGTTFCRLSSACKARGWVAKIAEIDSLVLMNNQPHWRCQDQWETVGDTHFLWVLGFGRRVHFLDKMQLLAMAEQQIPVINSTEGLVFWHSKYLSSELNLAGLKTPITMASNEAEWLWSKICQQGGDWVIKPPGGSHGNGISKIVAGDDNGLLALKRLTATGYCLVQAYIPEIAYGEKRVLMAGGKIIGQYKRLPVEDFRANLACGGQAVACELDAQEQDAVARLATKLRHKGILFTAIDLCWPWLIEINVANPGGLDTMASLYGEDKSGEILSAIIQSLQ